MTQQAPTLVPRGTDVVEHWARGRRLHFERQPHPTWFRRWEPFDTMIAPAHYLNAASSPEGPGQVRLVEPWTETGGLEPMDRTVMAFIVHPHLRYRASVRLGEDFITRVSFLTDKPPTEVELGDPQWDGHVKTLAKSADEARAAFTSALRTLLYSWPFRGHLELRPGGAVLHCTGLKPTPQHYDELGTAAVKVLHAALTPG